MPLQPSPVPSASGAAFLVGALSVLVGVALWWLASVLLNNSALLPAPPAVVGSFVELTQSGMLPAAIGGTLMRVVAGYGIGVLGGILTGLLLGHFRSLNDIFGPIFEFLKGVPPIALVPLLILWLGIGELPKFIIVAYIVWIVVTIGTFTGVNEILDVRRRSGRFLGLSQLDILRRIILPSAMPYILSAMRSGIGFAFIAVVSAELVASKHGVGALIMDARFSAQTAHMIVGLIVLGLLGNLAQYLFDVTVRRSRWLARFDRR